MNLVELHEKIIETKPSTPKQYDQLINEGFVAGSLNDPKYIKTMEFLFDGLARTSAAESKGPLPKYFVDNTISGYVTAFSEKSPDFKNMKAKEEEQWTVNGTVKQFINSIRNAMKTALSNNREHSL